VIRTGLLWLIALFYTAAGYAHLANPAPFLLITPPWVPAPEAVVALTGLAELAGAAGLLQPWSAPLRRADLDRAGGGAGLGYHVPRLAFQPVLIWLALWVSHATDWPFAKQGSKAGA
jgi:uncharacterized membrane protein